MFTGIIEAIGEVKSRTSDGLTLTRPAHFADIKIGSSISVSGVCLSVIGLDKKTMQFDVVPETFKKSKLGSLQPGDRVNLERAMKADGRFDGHIVQGHCDATGRVIGQKDSKEERQKDAAEVRNLSSLRSSEENVLMIEYPSNLAQFVIPLGSIAIDGVSLTIAECDKKSLTVALVPHTLQHTTLGSFKEGDQVNLETDILGKYIIHSKQR